jgi:hypothetical protein
VEKKSKTGRDVYFRKKNRVLIHRHKNIISRKTRDITVSADEHLDQTMEEFLTPARTQSLVDDDRELIRFSEEDKVYVRLFVFSLFSSFFFLSPCARAPQTTKQK